MVCVEMCRTTFLLVAEPVLLSSFSSGLFAVSRKKKPPSLFHYIFIYQKIARNHLLSHYLSLWDLKQDPKCSEQCWETFSDPVLQLWCWRQGGIQLPLESRGIWEQSHLGKILSAQSEDAAGCSWSSSKDKKIKSKVRERHGWDTGNGSEVKHAKLSLKFTRPGTKYLPKPDGEDLIKINRHWVKSSL